MHIIVFEDEDVSYLYPVTTGKPAFAVSMGSLRLIDLVKQLDGELELIVRPHLKELVREEYPEIWSPEKGPRKGPYLLINARTVPDAGILDIWRNMIRVGSEGVLYWGNTGTQVVAAFLGERTLFPSQEIGSGQLTGLLRDLSLPQMKKQASALLLDNVCDVIRYNMEIIDSNLDYRLATNGYREIRDGVFIPKECDVEPEIGEYFVHDTKSGPILLESGVTIGPFCYIRGPVHIGPKSKVIERTTLKDMVSIGRVCKIGGEVEASTIEQYTNKQHHGFLGHSYLGSWVNLGAGTCNSDLKNSYGEVCMETSIGKKQSGMQFLGCIVGDYSKTAINTSIFTGKTIGVCSMNYGFVTTAVPSFVNYARSFGQVTELAVETMIYAQARMFQRRNVQARSCDVQLIKDMYELTQHERQLASEPLSL